MVGLLIWVLCFLAFSVGGFFAAFYPEVIRRSLLSAPESRFKFIPKPEDTLAGRMMGGRKYLEGKSYVATLRIIGFISLGVAAFMLVQFVGALFSR